jgi:anaerobic ribonucleoside-triphosphate reductase activating protein
VSPELQEPGGYRAVEDIAEVIAAPLRRLGALTVSGGEPFEQPAALVALMDLLRRSCDFDTVMYTGYLFEELCAAAAVDPAIGELLERTDLLIDGPYDETASNEMQWRGSDNQRTRALSDRARGIDLDAPMPQRRPLAVQALPSGGFRIVGIPRRGEVQPSRRAVRGGLA